jgi:hypothetical protein
MAKRRTATNVLALKGSFKKNPSRARDRDGEPFTNAPLGPAPLPTTLTFAQAWDYVTSTVPDDVLKRRDRVMVELAARLLMAVRASDVPVVPYMLRLEQIMARLGCSPSDASRVYASRPLPPNEFDDVGPPKRG